MILSEFQFQSTIRKTQKYPRSVLHTFTSLSHKCENEESEQQANILLIHAQFQLKPHNILIQYWATSELKLDFFFFLFVDLKHFVLNQSITGWQYF